MGISALFGTLIIPESILIFALPMMIIGTLLYFFIVQDRVVTYIEGISLVMFYILFVGFYIGVI
jgi:cation:H+ antiporter